MPGGLDTISGNLRQLGMDQTAERVNRKWDQRILDDYTKRSQSGMVRSPGGGTYTDPLNYGRRDELYQEVGNRSMQDDFMREQAKQQQAEQQASRAQQGSQFQQAQGLAERTEGRQGREFQQTHGLQTRAQSEVERENAMANSRFQQTHGLNTETERRMNREFRDTHGLNTARVGEELTQGAFRRGIDTARFQHDVEDTQRSHERQIADLALRRSTQRQTHKLNMAKEERQIQQYHLNRRTQENLEQSAFIDDMARRGMTRIMTLENMKNMNTAAYMDTANDASFKTFRMYINAEFAKSLADLRSVDKEAYDAKLRDPEYMAHLFMTPQQYRDKIQGKVSADMVFQPDEKAKQAAMRLKPDSWPLEFVDTIVDGLKGTAERKRMAGAKPYFGGDSGYKPTTTNPPAPPPPPGAPGPGSPPPPPSSATSTIAGGVAPSPLIPKTT
jgi:hypothetical protein